MDRNIGNHDDQEGNQGKHMRPNMKLIYNGRYPLCWDNINNQRHRGVDTRDADRKEAHVGWSSCGDDTAVG
jgi:hypothetical protein